MLSLSAHCADGDVVQPFVTDTYTYYSNLFLIPVGTPANSPGIPDPKLSDKSNEVDAGFLFNNTYGQQDFIAQVKFSKVDFEHFQQIDYVGHDMLLDWDWKISNFLEGKLGATDIKALQPYTDFHLQERDLTDIQHEYASADLKMTPEWRLHTGVDQTKTTFDLPIEQILDNTLNTEEIGLNYVTYTDSKTGLLLRHSNGDFPFYQEFDGTKISNSFTQNEVDLNLDWHLTSLTELTLLGGYVKRTSQLVTQLQTFGVNGRANLDYVVSDKLKLDLGIWREFEPVQTGEIGYEIDDGGKVALTWSPTGKIELAGWAQYDKRQFFDFINGVLGPYYDDATSSYSLSAKYTPRQYLDITVAATRILRTSQFPEIAFLGNGGSITANLKF